jgi:hypothetical protein
MAMNEGLKALLINKLKTMGVDPADAARLAGQPWFQDYATQVYKGTLPKGVPEITEKEIKGFYSTAKKTGADPVQLFATEVSPSSVGARAGARAAFDAIKNDPQPTSPTPLPTTGGAPAQGSLAAPPTAAPTAAPATAAPMAAPTLASATGFETAPTFNVRPPLNVTPTERDRIIRTTYGEAAGGGIPEMGAVANTIVNRKLMNPNESIVSVTRPSQYEPWSHPSRVREMNQLSGAEYDKVAKIVDPILAGTDPGPAPEATHFFAPKAQAALGRPVPPWGKDPYPQTDFGRQRFSTHAYGTMEKPPGGEQPFQEVAQSPDSGPTVAAPEGGAPMEAAYNNAPVASPEQDMGQMATLGAFPMPGEPGVEQPTPPPETVSSPQAPQWQPLPDPEQTKYVTGPGSYMTSVPQPPAAPASPVDAFNQPPPPFLQTPTVGGAPEQPPLGNMPQVPGTGLDDVMGTGSTGTDVAGYQGPNALPQNQFGPAPVGGMDQSAFPMTAGPPGTFPSQSPIEPNTYRPANTMFPQTMSPKPPQMSPFNPATAPPLGAPTPQPPQAAAPQNPYAVPARLPTPPGIFVSHQAGFDPNQDMTSTGYTSASAYAPSAPSAPSALSRGFSPTQAPTIGMSPVMGALAASAGMGGAAQSGFAHGPTPAPTSPGVGFNPATFAGLKAAFTPQGGQFSGMSHNIPGMPLPIRKPMLPPLISPPTPASADPGKSGSSGVQQAQSAQQAAMAAKSAQAKIAAQQAAMQSIGAMSAMNALSSLANSGGAMAGLYKDLNYGMNIGFGGGPGGGLSGGFGGM